jgi:CheY-like chemotaxis protein
MNSIKTILIIEDNCESLLLYGEILRDEDFTVIETEDGQAAIDFLEGADVLPDLIIMDLTFPKMTAEEFVSGVKARPRLANIPILVISGHVDTEERSIALKAKGYIKKPFDLELFVSTIKNIINSSPGHHEASV